MAETAEERLERLRREVMRESTAAAAPAQPPPTAASPPAPPSSPAATPPALASLPAAIAPAPHIPPTAAVPPSAPPPSDGGPPGAVSDAAGWSISEALGELGTGRIVGVGLVVLGVYLLASQLFPFLSIVGSIVLLAGGIVLLAVHFQGRAGAWALYGGAVLTALGAARTTDDLLPFVPSRGLTSLAIGIAFLAISYLRHSQAGGYGWQAFVGIAFLAWGAIQLLLGLLPGSPGLLDLVIPLLLVAGGGFILLRAIRRRPGAVVSP